MARRKQITYEYSHDGIKQSVIRQAKSMSQPDGWAEQMGERVARAIDKWIADKDIVTEDDLRQKIIDELQVLNQDVAFAYQNHDRII